MSAATPVTLVGATGLTGAEAYKALLKSKSSAFAVTTLARKALPAETPANAATTTTPKQFNDLFDAPKGQVATQGGVYVSCLGTTRGIAGGVEQQRRIDLDLNRELAQKAKADGASTMILVSSGGANASSFMAYPQMKGQLEEDVKAMDFDHCVILRPGLLVGERNDTRIPEYTTQVLFRGLRAIRMPFMNHMMVDGREVGECIAYLAAHPPADKVSILNNQAVLDTAKKWRELNVDK